MVKWPWISRKKHDEYINGLDREREYDRAVDKIEKLELTNEMFRKEVEACWKCINKSTDQMRKAERAKQPRDKDGRWVRT